MKRITLYLSVVLSGLFSVGALAQYNMSTTYVGHNDINSHRYEPSELDLGEKRFQIGFNAYLWAGNTSLTWGAIQSFMNNDVLSEQDKEDLLKDVEGENLFGGGLDAQLLGIAYQLRNKKGKKIDLSFSVVDKANVIYEYTDAVMELALKGNGSDRFLGNSVDLGSNLFKFNYYREFGVGAAFPLFGNPGDQEGLGMRLGVRAKYLQGLAGINLEKGRAAINTAADGTSVTMSYDYLLHAAGTNVSGFDFATNVNGTGMGFDLGAALFIGKHWEINASVLDIGKITYDTEDIRTFKKQGDYVYDGLVITEFFGDFEFEGDPAGYIFEPEETQGESFDMNLGTRLLLQVEYKVPTKEVVKERKDGSEKTIEYSPHTFFLTYVQGFENAPGATTRPFASFGYNYNFHKSFDMGVMLGYGGFNQLYTGIFLDVNVANFWKIGIGSDNLTPIFVEDSGTGIDFQFSTSLSF